MERDVAALSCRGQNDLQSRQMLYIMTIDARLLAHIGSSASSIVGRHDVAFL